MVNKESRRIERIEKIKSMIRKCQAEEREIDYKKFCIEIMSTLRVSERVAKEYIKVALFELGKK